MLEREPLQALDPRDASRDAPSPAPLPEPPPPTDSIPTGARRHDVRIRESDRDDPMIYLVGRRPVSHLRADPVGKAVTIAQSVACAVAVGVPAWARPVAAVAAVLGLAAVVHDLRRERA